MQQKILLLITALEHIHKSDGFYSHSPFVKEINYIGNSYDEIVIFAPLSKNKILINMIINETTVTLNNLVSC